MGPEIIVISGFRNKRGQKSAYLVIYEPRNNSSSNLSELGLFDYWILPRTKYVTTAYTVPGMIPVCCISRPSPTAKNQKHTYDSMPRLLCARQSFVLTQTRQQQQHHHRNHRHTTPAPQQQHSSSIAAVPGMIPVCCVRHHHPQQRITNTPTTAYRACVRDRA